MAHQAGAYPGFCSIKGLGILILPLNGMLDHRSVTPSIKISGTNLYAWVERGTVRVKCLPKNTTQCPWSGLDPDRSIGVECTNHEATAPPKFVCVVILKRTKKASVRLFGYLKLFRVVPILFRMRTCIYQ